MYYGVWLMLDFHVSPIINGKRQNQPGSKSFQLSLALFIQIDESLTGGVQLSLQ